jgi:hypothetical protein
MQPEWVAKIVGDWEDPRRRLETLFGEPPASSGPQPAARRWASDVLHQGNIDPDRQQAAAIRLLRKNEPRLTLKTATYLVRNMTSA